MFNNIIKIAFRNLVKNFGYTFINVFGLAIGLASSILIFLYVSNELSYDRFHEKSDRTYRIWIHVNMAGTELRHAVSSSPMAEAMLNDYPEVESTVRLRGVEEVQIQSGDRKYHEEENCFIYADSSFFDVFSFKLIKGDPKTCLKNPRSLVLTEEYAEKYFKGEDPMGKSLRVKKDTNFFIITGIMEDLPDNSHFDFNMLASMNTVRRSKSTNWLNHNFYTYFVLAPGTDPAEFEIRLQDMMSKYVGPILEDELGASMEKFTESGNFYGYRVQSIEDIHLHSNLQYEFEAGGNPMYVYIFIVIAVLILIIACINFMNLATARSTTRAREVGLRKVVGSSRSLLITQFLTESVFLSLFALLVGIVMVYLLLPAYNNLIELDLDFDLFNNSLTIPLLILFAVIIGLISGIYPALVLTRFRPIAVLKAEVKGGSSRSFLRNLLIVLQFAITIVILLGTTIVNRQLNFMQKKDPGFNKDRVLLVHRADVLGNRINAFKSELRQHSNILELANATHVPSSSYSESAHWLEGMPRSDIFTLATWRVSYNFDQDIDLEIIEGSFFRPDMPTDSFGVVVNEATIKAYDIKDPLNTRFYTPEKNGEISQYFPIIGVVKDFHSQSMHEEIRPMAIHFLRGNYGRLVTIKLGNDNLTETIDYVNGIWEEFISDYPFEYSWLDDEITSMYETEKRTAQIMGVSSILSIFLSCLGLLGLISYTTNQRIKEIGIRKTFGASVNIIILLLSRETLRLLMISALLSIPAWFGIRTWLQNFAYHINFNIIIYAGTLLSVTLVVFIIAILTVSYNSYRAATANPAQSLKLCN